MTKEETVKFDYFDLYWKDSGKKEFKKVVDLLNTLTKEEKKAVWAYGVSRYDKGNEDGYESGYSETSEY